MVDGGWWMDEEMIGVAVAWGRGGFAGIENGSSVHT